MKHLFLWGISFVFFASVSAFGAQAKPQFSVKIGVEETSNLGAWLVELLPPPNHHFNVNAPFSVKTTTGQEFVTRVKVKERLGFRSNFGSPATSEGTRIVASAFLCDQAKTYCVKSEQEIELKKNSDLKKLDEVRASDSKIKKAVVHSFAPGEWKDELGFWNNRADDAIAEAKITHKPLLIDFYGIWCPPCNLFNEQVFSKKSFQKLAQKFVLLKMDADRETSYELKSKFKVGGYPTIVVASENLEEKNRVVGFYSLKEFNKILSDTLAGKKGSEFEENKKIIELQIEKKEFSEALAAATEAIKKDLKNAYYAIVKLYIESTDHPEVLKKEESISFLKGLLAHPEKEDISTLVHLSDIVMGQADLLSKDMVKSLGAVYDEASKRVNPETLSVKGVELSIADIDAMRIDWAELLKDETLVKKMRAQAIASYEKLMAKFNAQDSRGYNLELAYLLWKDGRVNDARAIYDRMIKKYPNEFTFYFAASKMFLELKDLKNAKEYAKNAVKYAYGDNLMRATERYVRVLTASGEVKEAKLTAVEFLKSHPKVSGLHVRANRYLEQIEKAMKEIKL